MSKPKTYLLTHEDVLFFYDFILAKSDKDIESRKRIDKIAKKLKLSFEIKTSTIIYKKDKYNIQNTLWIFYPNEIQNYNKTLFRHLRNAFCHKYVSIEEGRCKLLDWNQYSNGKKNNYAEKHISLIGDVCYKELQTLIKEFLSEKSKTKKKRSKKINIIK